MTGKSGPRRTLGRTKPLPVDPDMIVKPGLVREMVAIIDRRHERSKEVGSDIYSIRDNSFSDDRCDTTADMELELQYMALDLSPYVSMDRASQIIEDIQRLSPTSTAETAKSVSSSRYLFACASVVFVIALLASLIPEDSELVHLH